jgi:hypothetical protein
MSWCRGDISRDKIQKGHCHSGLDPIVIEISPRTDIYIMDVCNPAIDRRSPYK